MRTYLAALVFSVCVSCVSAQLNPLPPASGADGIYLRAGSENTSWNTSALADYAISPSSTFVTPAAGSNDVYGRRWTSGAFDRTSLGLHGGSIRAIALGSSGSWVEGVGYSYSGTLNSGDSFTFGSISGIAAPSSWNFGDVADICLIPGDAFSFDFWISTSDGAFTLFDPSNSAASGSAPTSIRWLEQPLLVPTFIPSVGSEGLVETWIVSLIQNPADLNQPAREYRFALQQFENSGGPLREAPALLAPSAVPEPSTFAWAASALCVGAIALRKRRASTQD